MKSVESFRVHNLKCCPEPFSALKNGEKTHEVRVDDRQYQVGDVLCLREWDQGTMIYSGDLLEFVVTHKTTGFGLSQGFCVMSLRPIKWVIKSCKNCGGGFRTYDEAHTCCSGCF